MTRTTRLVAAVGLLLGATASACSDDGDDEAQGPAVTIDEQALCDEAVEAYDAYEPSFRASETVTAKQASDLHNDLDPNTDNPWEARDEDELVAKCLMEFGAPVDNFPGQEMWFILMSADGPREPLPAPEDDEV